MYIRWLPVFLALLGCFHAAQALAEWPQQAILLAEAEDDEDEDDDDDGGGSGYVHSYSAPSYSSYSASPRHYSRARRAPRAHHAKRYSRSHKAKHAHRVSRHASAKSHHGRVHGLKHSSRKPTHGRKHHAVKTSHGQSAHKAVRSGKLRSRHHGTASRYRQKSQTHHPVVKAGVKTRTHAKHQPRPRVKHHAAAPSGKTHSRPTSKRQWVTRHSERPRTAVKRRPDTREQRLHAKVGKKAAVSRGPSAKKPVHAKPAALHGKSRPSPTSLTRRQQSTRKPSTSSRGRPEAGKLRRTRPAPGKPATKPVRRPTTNKPGKESRHTPSKNPETGLQTSKVIGRKGGSHIETPAAKRGAESQKTSRLASAKAAKRGTESTKQVKSGSRTTPKVTRRQESERVPGHRSAQPNTKKRN
ncbi:MAG: hypothetical protein RLZZ09_2431 [Pseudomonadota bacterium]